MKIRGILLTLFLSLAGISLVGCGFFDAVKEVSAAAAKKMAEEAKTTAEEAGKAAEKEKTDNPNADHSVCDEVIVEAPTIAVEADAAIEAAKAAESDTAKTSEVTAAHDQAKAVKEKADAVKAKAEGCAKEKPPVKATECWVKELEEDVKCTKGNETLGSRFIVYADVEGKQCVKASFTVYEPAYKSEDCSSAEVCKVKQDAWIKAHEGNGYTCNK